MAGEGAEELSLLWVSKLRDSSVMTSLNGWTTCTENTVQLKGGESLMEMCAVSERRAEHELRYEVLREIWPLHLIAAWCCIWPCIKTHFWTNLLQHSSLEMVLLVQWIFIPWFGAKLALSPYVSGSHLACGSPGPGPCFTHYFIICPNGMSSIWMEWEHTAFVSTNLGPFLCTKVHTSAPEWGMFTSGEDRTEKKKKSLTSTELPKKEETNQKSKSSASSRRGEMSHLLVWDVEQVSRWCLPSAHESPQLHRLPECLPASKPLCILLHQHNWRW